MLQASHQIVQHIADADGLYGGVDPGRSEHDGHAVHQVAQHLKGSAPRTEYHGGAENGRRDRPGLEDAGHLMSRSQVLAQKRIAAQAEPTQIDNPLEPGSGCSGHHVLSGPAVGLDEPLTGGSHRVHQVERGPAAGGCPLQVIEVLGIALDYFEVGVRSPGAIGQLGHGSRHRPDSVTSFQQLGHQPPPNIPGCAHHQDRLGLVLGHNACHPSSCCASTLSVRSLE